MNNDQADRRFSSTAAVGRSVGRSLHINLAYLIARSDKKEDGSSNLKHPQKDLGVADDVSKKT